MELQPDTLCVVDRYWQDFFGCPELPLGPAQTLVRPHVGLGDYHGLWLLRRGATLLISVPTGLDPGLLERLRTLSAADFAAAPGVVGALGLAIERTVGPAFVGYADAATLRPAAQGAARVLRPADRAAWEELRATVPPLAWEHGGSAFGDLPLAGVFAGSALVALAGYELWGTRIAHIAVVTHPDHQGRGYGRAAVSLLARTVLAHGCVPQYRTLGSNAPSLRIAAQLGFAEYAWSLAVRLG